MARGRTKGPARNAAQLSRSYSKLAYRLTSFRPGRIVDGVLRCCDRADSFRYTGFRGTDACVPIYACARTRSAGASSFDRSMMN